MRKITQKSGGVSTLGGVDIWYDEHLGRLNRDERGRLLGKFDAKDSILVIYKDGQYELTSFDLTNRYEPNEIQSLSRFEPETVVSAVYYEANQKAWYVKRFKVETTTLDKKFSFIGDVKGSKNLAVTTDRYPRIEIVHQVKDRGPVEKMVLEPEGFIEIRGWKALGNKLPFARVKDVKLLEPKVVKEAPAAVREPELVETDEPEPKETAQLGLFS